MTTKVIDHYSGNEFEIEAGLRPLSKDYDFGSKVRKYFFNGDRVTRDQFIRRANLNWEDILFKPHSSHSELIACTDFYDKCMHLKDEGFKQWFEIKF